MIIANALQQLFSGATVDLPNNPNFAIKYHYGDQKELLLWVNSQNAKNASKYPLVWYILNAYTELNGWYETDATICIMQMTKAEYLNNNRVDNIYFPYINPTWDVIKNKLLTSTSVQIVSRDIKNRFIIKDEPNYGVDVNNESMTTSDFKSKKAYGEKAIVTDVVDARFIKFRLKIKADCLINNN